MHCLHQQWEMIIYSLPVVANSHLAPSHVCVQQDGKHMKVRLRI